MILSTTSGSQPLTTQTLSTFATWKLRYQYTLKNKRIRLYSKTALPYALIFDLRLLFRRTLQICYFSHAMNCSIAVITGIQTYMQCTVRCYKHCNWHKTHTGNQAPRPVAQFQDNNMVIQCMYRCDYRPLMSLSSLVI